MRDAGPMASPSVLFNCAASDVTLDRVRALVDQIKTETTTVEYKRDFASGFAMYIAAMANAYGGLILVGVDKTPSPNRIVGVPRDTDLKIVNACFETLEPPSWQPEIIPVPLDDSGERFVVVVRIDSSRAPRPVLYAGTAPIRLHGRVAKADRAHLGRLFSEPGWPSLAPRQFIKAPQLPVADDGSRLGAFIIRSGIELPLEGQALWRSLSDRALDSLGAALGASPAKNALGTWLFASRGSRTPFARSGLSSSRHAELLSQVVPPSRSESVFDASAKIDLPRSRGVAGSVLQFTLDLGSLAATSTNPSGRHTMAIGDLYALLHSLLATLVEPNVVAALADIAGVESALAVGPASAELVTGPSIGDLLEPIGLRRIPDAGDSWGASLEVNPTYDLSDPTELGSQLDEWTVQIALDAGLQGMEAALERFHADQRRRS